MGLATLTIPRETISYPGGDFAVRGLSTKDVTALLREHKSFLEECFAQSMQAEASRDLGVIAQYAIVNAPEFVARVIALAADEGDDPAALDMAMTLPMPVQFEALQKIGKLTFDVCGGVENFAKTVILVSRGLTDTITTLRA